MSQAALDYVQGSVVVKSLPAAEKFVLRQLAMLHRLEVNCAFASMPQLAEMCLIGGKDPVRQCRRIVERLERKGLVVRHVSVRSNGSQMSNEFELPGMRADVAVTEQGRQQTFKVPRTRVAAQLSLLTGDGALFQTRQATSGDVSPAAVVAEEECEKCPGVGGHLSVRGGEDSKVSALEVSFDVSLEVSPPLPLLGAVESAKSADHEQKQGQATAKATATTSSLRAPVTSTESVDQARASSAPGFRVAGRVIPFRQQRQAREPRNVDEARDQLDGEEAALFDEALRVLICAGRPRDLITRSERKVVIAQLRSYVARKNCTIHDAGRVASDMWQQYLEANDAGLLFRPVGIKAFIGEALWLGKDRWHYDAVAVRESRSIRRL